MNKELSKEELMQERISFLEQQLQLKDEEVVKLKLRLTIYETKENDTLDEAKKLMEECMIAKTLFQNSLKKNKKTSKNLRLLLSNTLNIKADQAYLSKLKNSEGGD